MTRRSTIAWGYLTAALSLLACHADIAATVTDPAIFTILHRFTRADGYEPRGRLVLAPDGGFYTTLDLQVVRITMQGEAALLHALPDQGANARTLMLATDGNLYGITYSGSQFGLGEIYRLRTDGTVSTLHAFNTHEEGPAHYPPGLTQGADGALYGAMPTSGPSGGIGAVFRVGLDGTYSLIRLSELPDQVCCGTALLTLAADGSFYGVSERGGSQSFGDLFKVTPSGELTVLHRFDGTDGSWPRAPLIRARDGNYYGTTMNVGGPRPGPGCGGIYRLTPAGVFTVLHTFSREEGCDPETPLVEAPDGVFYGAANRGGNNFDQGTIYKITADGQFTVLYRLDYTRGNSLDVELALGPDGNIYGTSSISDKDATAVFFRLVPKSVTRFVLTTGSGTEATIKSGVLRFRDTTSEQHLTVHVARPAFAAQQPGMANTSIGPWVWLSDDERDAAMINLDTSGNATIQIIPVTAARQLLGKP